MTKDNAALIGLSDGSYWAIGGKEIPQPDEVKSLLEYVSAPAQILKSGITINKIKYFGLQHGFDGESRFVIFKKGYAGGCVYTTNQLMICAVYGPECPSSNEARESYNHEPVKDAADIVNPSDCHSTVKKIASYLSELGY